MNRIKNNYLEEKFKNEIKSTSYLTHGIHRYTAKLIPHIPRFYIDNYTNENDIVIDPFCGSGTSLLEARILGRNAIGFDLNPLATLISKVKSTPLEFCELSSVVKKIKMELKIENQISDVNIPNIDYWFSPIAQKELSSIKNYIDSQRNIYSEEIINFLLVTFSSIIRISSYADRKMAKTYKSKRMVQKIENGWKPAPIQYFLNALEKNVNMMKSLIKYLSNNTNYVRAHTGDARNTYDILNSVGVNKVDFIITSPPYINAQDYFRSYKFEIWWLGLATPKEVLLLKKESIGSESVSHNNRKIKPQSEDDELQMILDKLWSSNRYKSNIVNNFFNEMNSTLYEFNKSLSKNGHLCLITGNNTICGVSIPTNKILNKMAEHIGFRQVELVKDKIQNRNLSPNRNHNGGFIKEEWISVFEI